MHEKIKWVLTHEMEDGKRGYLHFEELTPADFGYRNVSLDDANVVNSTFKESDNAGYIEGQAGRFGFKDVKWEILAKVIWIVSVTDDVSVACSGSERRYETEIPRDGILKEIPIIPAISTFIFNEYSYDKIVECVNSYLKAQDMEGEMYEDDTIQVIKDTDDLKMYKFVIEDEADEDEEYEIYIQVERKILY